MSRPNRSRISKIPPIQAAKVNGRTPAAIRRMLTQLQSAANFSMSGSELGRLLINETITEPQYQAGTRYAELRAKWRQVQGLPEPTARAIELGKVSAVGHTSDAGGCDEALRSAVDEVDAALSARQKRALDLVCDRDCIVVGYEMLLDLGHGLNELIELWGKRGGRKNGASPR